MSEIITLSEAPIVAEGEWSQTGLRLPDNLAQDDWIAIGRKLRTMEQSVMWWIGDWLAYGERKYGETYQLAAEATGYNRNTLYIAKTVSESFDVLTRVNSLSWSVHRALSPLKPEDRLAALDEASRNGWTQREATAEMKRRRGDTLPRREVAPDSSFGYALRSLSRLIGAVFDIDPNEFTGDDKGAPAIVEARQVLCYLLITEAGFREIDVAEGLGRHHSTVSHALEVITDLRDDPAIDQTFTWLGEAYRALAEAQETFRKLGHRAAV